MKEDGIEVVNLFWLRKKMKKHKVRQKDFALLFKEDKSNVNKWIKGKIELSRSRKLALLYYFNYIELKAEFDEYVSQNK